MRCSKTISPPRASIRYKESVDASWIKDELWETRNFHQAFENGLVSGLFHTAVQQITGGRGLHEIYPAHAGHTRMKHLDQLPADGGKRAHLLGKAKVTANLPLINSLIFIIPVPSMKKISLRT